MSNSVKVTLYALLVLIASISGYFALTSFGKMMARAGERHSDLEQIEPERKPAPEPESAPSTNTPGTNVTAATNITAAATNAVAAVSTNTNAAPVIASTTNAPAATDETSDQGKAPRRVSAGSQTSEGATHLGLWAALFIASLIGLGLLIASDVSHYLGNRALKTLYNDEGEGQKDPEYDKAEEVWANGEHLEAIKMMREYLAKNPREQHVAIRIAEIYEKDLKNNLAAALEYEEVLKHKLQAERWAWAAVHLCNLYFRLSQEQKGYALLRRIVNEYPNTAAAEKARKRLEQIDGSEFVPESPAPPGPRPQAPGTPPSNLPPGFRPKK